MVFTQEALEQLAASCLTENEEGVSITDENALRGKVIDYILGAALFSQEDTLKKRAEELIHHIMRAAHITSAPTTALYHAIQIGEVTGFTVPAINLRIMPYEVATTIFKLMQKHNIGIVIFELARSEMGYSNQTPSDVALTVMGAAIKAGYRGSLFLQGDHYQVNKDTYTVDAVGELNKLKQLIIDSIKAQMYNIDIDGSTIVDLSQPTIEKQQEQNSVVTAELTNFIRMHQPEGVDIMVGGEIGHIGEKNSTKEDLDAFMKQYLPKLYGKGIGKISIQTGTQHGGNVDAAGKVQAMPVDMDLIKTVGEHARSVYSLAGIVQHGASTLPKEKFSEFPNAHTVEIHLSTGIQNVVFDSLPEDLRNTIYSWLTLNCDKDRKAEWTDEQFFYRTRKKAIAAFKEQLWELSEEQKQPILTNISSYLEELFLSLGMKDTKEIVARYYA